MFRYIKAFCQPKIDFRSKDLNISQGKLASLIWNNYEDHHREGNLFKQIRTLTNNYTPDDDSKKSHVKLLYGLREFEKDLHRHVHLENNVLYPKALDLIKQ